MGLTLFDVSRVTGPVAIIFCSAWITIYKSFAEGLYFMFFSAIFLVILFLLEITWIEHKHDRNIR